MIVKAEIIWSADDMTLLNEPGISRAAAAVMLGVNPITIGRWVRSNKIVLLPGTGKICTSSLRTHIEAEIARATAKSVKFGGKADA